MNNPVDNQSPLSMPQKEGRLPSKISENGVNAKLYDNPLLNFTVLAMTQAGHNVHCVCTNLTKDTVFLDSYQPPKNPLPDDIK